MIVQAVHAGMEKMSRESENDSQEEEKEHQLMDLELEQQEDEQGLNRDNYEDSSYELGLKDLSKEDDVTDKIPGSPLPGGIKHPFGNLFPNWP